MTTNLGDWLCAAGAAVCSVLQLASFMVSQRAAQSKLLTGGRAMLLIAWVVAACRLAYLVAEGEPLAGITQVWIGLFELGTVLVTAHWIVDAEDRC